MTVHHNNDNNDLGEDQTYQRLVNINAVIKGYNQPNENKNINPCEKERLYISQHIRLHWEFNSTQVMLSHSNYSKSLATISN